MESRKLNEIKVKKKAQMPNMEELISRISRKIADGPTDEIWISKFDLDYHLFNGLLHFGCKRGKFYLLLPLSEVILHANRHTSSVFGKNRPNIGK